MVKANGINPSTNIHVACQRLKTEKLRNRNLIFKQLQLTAKPERQRNEIMCSNEAMSNSSELEVDTFDGRNSLYIVSIMKHCMSQMKWNAISSKKRACTEFPPENRIMNSQCYLEILKCQLVIDMNIHQIDTVVHDGASCDHSKIVSNSHSSARLPQSSQRPKTLSIMYQRSVVL